MWARLTTPHLISMPSVRWTARPAPSCGVLLPATGLLSSPAVTNGVVYAGSYDGNLYALDAKTGEKLWSYPAGGFVISSPAVANGVVYIASDVAILYALDARTGAKLWDETSLGIGAFASPAVADGMVYLPAYNYADRGKLYAFGLN